MLNRFVYKLPYTYLSFSLTPHRKKSVRNPRVKKKEKYKEKQKKLKSMKPVFDRAAAAKGSANYGGELTGIKKGLVRSRKL